MSKDSATHTGIGRVALEMAYGNDVINQNKSEASFLIEFWCGFALFLITEIGKNGIPAAWFVSLSGINEWLATLSEENVETLCCGDIDGKEGVVEAILGTASQPQRTKDLLGVIFGLVCGES